ncbi:MAG: ATP-binding protein [Caulobacteraceae bacterium]|nr:ATP-binding protein [Caulobacteraceae bacterium]
MGTDYNALIASASDAQADLPPTVLLYGEGGVGKTTFASHAPAPVLLAAEDGARRIRGVKRLPGDGVVESWTQALELTRAVAYGEHQFKTFIVDTLDLVEPHCVAHLVKSSGKRSFEAMGWGKDEALLAEWRVWLGLLEHIRNKRNMMVILIAHAAARTINDPTLGSFSGWSGKCNKQVWAATYNWADLVMFAQHDLALHEQDNGKARSIVTGARVLHTQRGTGFEAKQREGFQLPARLPLSYDTFAEALGVAETADVLRARIRELVEAIGRDDVAKKAEVYLKKAGTNVSKLREIENNLKAVA